MGLGRCDSLLGDHCGQLERRLGCLQLCHVWGHAQYEPVHRGRRHPPNIVNVDYGVSSASLSVNQWHFLAFVANSQTGTVTFMQDGVAVGGYHYYGQLLASSSQLNIGDDPSDTSPGQGNWDGKIDDLAIWTRALSSQDLAGIYQAGLAGQSLLTLIPEPSVTAMCGLGILMAAWMRIAKRSTPGGAPKTQAAAALESEPG